MGKDANGRSAVVVTKYGDTKGAGESIGTMLSGEGFSTVERYVSPEPAVEALQKIQSGAHGKVDLVLTDLSVGDGEDCDGLRVAGAATDAGVPCVLLYTSETLVRDRRQQDLGQGKFGRGWTSTASPKYSHIIQGKF